jgi:hypothetical protein
MIEKVDDVLNPVRTLRHIFQAVNLGVRHLKMTLRKRDRLPVQHRVGIEVKLFPY